MVEEYLEQVKKVIMQGLHQEIEALVRHLLEKGVDPDRLINQGMIAAMDAVGQLFARGELFVPEMLASAHTMQKALALIEPFLKEDRSDARGTVVLCTVKGDIHDIGKNLVGMMLKGAGFRVLDLGTDLSVEHLIGHVNEIRPDILGLSALLTTTMPEMKKALEALEAQDLRNSIKVMVGGAPVDRRFADLIGADAYAADAAEAVRLARGLIR